MLQLSEILLCWKAELWKTCEICMEEDDLLNRQVLSVIELNKSGYCASKHKKPVFKLHPCHVLGMSVE